MVELVRAQSAVVLRPSHSTTVYRTRSVPDLSLYSRYTPKWPYRYYRDWDLYDDYWYDRYYYYSPLYRSTFFPRRYYYNNYALNPYSFWNYPYSYWTRYRGYLYDYPSYYSRYYYYYDDYPRYRYTYYYPYRYGYYSPFDRYWLSSTYWDRRFRDWCQEYLWPRIQSPPYLRFFPNFYTVWGTRPANFRGMASTSFSSRTVAKENSNDDWKKSLKSPCKSSPVCKSLDLRFTLASSVMDDVITVTTVRRPGINHFNISDTEFQT